MVCHSTVEHLLQQEQVPDDSLNEECTSEDVILVVDDSPDNLFLTESILLEDGYSVICAESGKQAIEILATNPPSLVLLDVMMPDMDGYEVTRLMRQEMDLPYIPILLITAHDRPCVVDGLDAGADDFIRKPIVEVDELLARVRSLLRLKHTIDERDHIARQREDFVSRLTHDLRTPLIAANRMLMMINQGTFGNVPSTVEESIDIVVRSNTNLLSMVNTLLEVYRYDSGNKSLTFSRFNICKLVDEVIEELVPLAQEKGIQLRTSCPTSLSDSTQAQSNPPASRKFCIDNDAADIYDCSAEAEHHGSRKESEQVDVQIKNVQDEGTSISNRYAYRISGDRLELRRVLTNIVGNAIKFTDEGAVNIKVRFEKDVSHIGNDRRHKHQPNSQDNRHHQSSNWVILDVTDTGAGIPYDDQAQIFEQFRQGKNRRAGSGLGLHLANRIIEAHGGSIHVDSKPEHGSTFTICLPANVVTH